MSHEPSSLRSRVWAALILCGTLYAALSLSSTEHVTLSEPLVMSPAMQTSPGDFVDGNFVANTSCARGVSIDGHCYCPMGWYGRRCDKLVSEWAVRFGLPSKLGKPSNWNAFLSPQFKMRYQLAAAALKRCRRILEIGAYKTPITEFVDGPNLEVVTAIDPNLRARYVRTVTSAFGHGPIVKRRLAYTINDYDFQELKEDCLVYIGLPDPSHISPQDLRRIEGSIASKKVVVLEMAKNFGERTIANMQSVIDRSNRDLKVRACVDLNFGVPGNVFELANNRTNSAFTKRRLCYFATDAAASEITAVTPDPEAEVEVGTPAFVFDNVPRQAKAGGVLVKSTAATASSWVQVRYDMLLAAMKRSISDVPSARRMVSLSNNGHGHGLLVFAKAAVEAGFDVLGVDSVADAWAIREEGGARLQDQGPEGWRPFEGGDRSGRAQDATKDCHWRLRVANLQILSQPVESEMVGVVMARAAVVIEDIPGLVQLCTAARKVWNSEARQSFRAVRIHAADSALDSHSRLLQVVANCTERGSPLLAVEAVTGPAHAFDVVKDIAKKLQVGGGKVLCNVRDEQPEARAPLGDVISIGGCVLRFKVCGAGGLDTTPALRWFGRVTRLLDSRGADSNSRHAVVSVGVSPSAMPMTVAIQGRVYHVHGRQHAGVIIDISSAVAEGRSIAPGDLVVLLPNEPADISPSIPRIVFNRTDRFECGSH